MKENQMLRLDLTSVLLYLFSAAIADGTADESADSWAVVEKEWNARVKGDQKTINGPLSDDVAVWEKGQSRSSVSRSRSERKRR